MLVDEPSRETNMTTVLYNPFIHPPLTSHPLQLPTPLPPIVAPARENAALPPTNYTVHFTVPTNPDNDDPTPVNIVPPPATDFTVPVETPPVPDTVSRAEVSVVPPPTFTPNVAHLQDLAGITIASEL
jgi:hypothetical protein